MTSTGTTSSDPLARLSAAGVAIWLDDLSRERLTSGGLATLVAERHVVGVTTNPSIFAAALAGGSSYDSQLADLAETGATPEQAVFVITTDDVRAAADVLRPVFDTTAGVDGRVSIEVDPRLAHDTTGTVAAARSLWSTVDRPNVLVKIPATVEGLPAITAVLAEGISVNVTLIFGVERYREVISAYLDGLEQAAANGHDLATITSVASFFVSRVDTAVDALLDGIGTADAASLRGAAAIANARLADATFRESVSTPRWEKLAAAGAHPQRPLWASTGVKDRTYSDTRYVDELVVDGVVNTMPEATLLAVADHGGSGADTVTGTDVAAAEIVSRLGALGIALTDVTRSLEAQGVAKFEASWEELLTTVAAGLDKESK